MKNSRSMRQFKQVYFAHTGALAKEAMRAKAQVGIYPLRLPIGYRRIIGEFGERIVLDAQKAPLVKLAFTLAAKKRSSLSQILSALRERGLTGHSGEPISRSALHRMLRNPFYKGNLPYKGISSTGSQPRLISQHLFDGAARAIVDRCK